MRVRLTPVHARRRALASLFGIGAAAAFPVLAQEGVDVGRQSAFTRLVPADQIESMSAKEYSQLLAQARSQNALAPENHPQMRRLRYIAERLIPLGMKWNARARQWRWEVNLIGSKQLNAFCMPGGKIVFFTGILQALQLDDDEVAQIMGHEMAHALREHARERMGKTAATRLGTSVISGLLGLGSTGDALVNMGGKLLTLEFSREDESEADLIGMELAARAGYEPQAAVRLWQKMGEANRGAPPQFLSTHPSASTRIRDLQANLARVAPLYAAAGKPAQRFDRG